MVVFLAHTKHLSIRQLHNRIKNRFQTDWRFENVRREITNDRDPGQYRVIAETDPQRFLDKSSYPMDFARIEVGFEKATLSSQDYDYSYWFSWIEPDRDFLLAWHQDTDHPSYGPVHIQVNQSDSVIEHRSAEFIDGHPMAIVETRLDQLPNVIDAVRWQDGRLDGIDC
jgi:hypothetical protein